MARTPKKAAGKAASKKQQPAKARASEKMADQLAQKEGAAAPEEGGGSAAPGLPEGLSLGTSEPKKRGVFGWILFILLLPFWPIRIVLRPLTRKWFGPLPLRFGPPPIDHSEPDFDSEEPGMLAGQVIFVLITAFFIIAFFWASTAELDEQVRAEGEVIPPADVHIIQSRLPGVVTEIGVQLGSRVTTGDILFRMEDEDVQANFADDEIIIASSRAALVRLEAEASGQAHIQFPVELIAAAPQAVAEETGLFNQRRIALLGELVPDSTRATIRARLLPQDVADVKIGQAVRISLAAYDVSRYGEVEGVVTRVANNATQQENMPPFYETLIKIPDLSFPRSPIKPELVPGMQATIDILGGKRTVMDYILTPIKKASRAAFREK
jgi:hypothetical protein